MNGLVIREPWISHILDGRKTWEIRGSNTRVRGKIGLIRSGSGLIVGSAYLVDSIGPLSDTEFLRNRDKHLVGSPSMVKYKKVYAWVLANAERFSKPIPYNHPQGAVIWVKIPEITTGSDPKYDPVIEAFLDSGHNLVRVDIPSIDNDMF